MQRHSYSPARAPARATAASTAHSQPRRALCRPSGTLTASGRLQTSQKSGRGAPRPARQRPSSTQRRWQRPRSPNHHAVKAGKQPRDLGSVSTVVAACMLHRTVSKAVADRPYAQATDISSVTHISHRGAVVQPGSVVSVSWRCSTRSVSAGVRSACLCLQDGVDRSMSHEVTSVKHGIDENGRVTQERIQQIGMYLSREDLPDEHSARE